MARVTGRRSRFLGTISVAIIAALGITAAILWPGYDVQRTPLETGAVWALQTGDGTRYARVNTDLGEIDTVRDVTNPSQLVQSTDRLLVYTQANASFSDVNLALPQQLDSVETEMLQRTPVGTVTVESAGGYIVYLTESGEVFRGSLSDPAASPIPVTFPGDRAESIDAIAVDEKGMLAAYSVTRASVQVIDLNTGALRDETRLQRATENPSLQLTLVDGIWYLLDPADELLWSSQNATPVSIDLSGQAQLQRSTPVGSGVYIADSAGLFFFEAGTEQAEREATSDGVAGVPARPVLLNEIVYAAWLGEGASSGSLWSSTDGVKPLSYAGEDIGDAPLPTFQASGSRAILNDTRSGWVWRVPNGDLVVSSQAWVSDQTDSQSDTTNEERAEQVLEPKPPVAGDDEFGVRADSQVALQVMLNDSDPNEDVLSIVPESLVGLPASFGTLTLGSDNQQVIVTVSSGAAGSASFSYRVTDGTSGAGLESNTATVTLTVVPQSTNRAPVWCGVNNCLARWPSPEVAPGDTVETEVLAGWVDPDGDPIFVSNVVTQGGIGSATYRPSGEVVYQHPDPNSEGDISVSLEVTVSDDRAATATKTLGVRVTSSPTLSAASFAKTAIVNQRLSVPALEYVTGVSGTAKLTALESLDTQRSQATIAANGTGFEFIASEPGSYAVRYTVRDDQAERTGLARIIVLAAEQARFVAQPVTVFVWSLEDTTVDLLQAVSNPTGSVLMVSNAQPEPVPNASLSIDLISQQFLRVSGSSDTGESGLLGRVQYDVVDASSQQRSLGYVSVILLTQPSPTAPIAVDDTLTVRAGTQVDIPVLDNDAAAPGNAMTIDPDSVTNANTSSLAFASGRLLRYLAPKQPGTYQLSYAVYTTGHPTLSDTATVSVTVLGDEANRKPQPVPLSGRVLSGEKTLIPFSSLGVDPDGDSVTLDRIVSQPDRGTAAISADGNAIEYTSEPGSVGQFSFEYQVRDSLGATGTALVRVAVRDAQQDPRPIAFTDVVQVQAGNESTVNVQPLENDIDPAGSRLTLVEVVPNAPVDSAEFRELADRIVSTDAQTAVIRAGTTLGSTSYTYTVKNSSGDTSMGLIVVTVIREPVVNAPVVTDTVLNPETREQFPRGVDVVTGKVRWASGDVAGLTLALWGDPIDLSIRTWSIAGPLPQQTRVIPFQVTGVGFNGEEQTSYGFLRVPGEDDLRLALRPNIPKLTVGEGDAVTFDMSKLVLVPAGSELDVLNSGVRASGVRADSECSVASGMTIRYQAGRGAPWSDSCTVPIKLASQNVYTYLTVPLSIEADKPQPELKPAALTVSPGESTTYDLRQMVSWTGGEDWAGLALAIDPGGADFTLEQTGTTLTIRAADRAKPGVQQTATVTVTSHDDVKPAALTLRVGPAPSTLPKGATVTQQCSQGDGSSCEITVIGQPGEVNPLPGTPLEVVSVENPLSCPNVTFTVSSANTIRASWTESAVGAQCTSNFIVRDAQERQSLGDRAGTVTLDLQGYPQAPASVTLRQAGDGSVRLAVSPGEASNAYPALEGFVILRGDREVATCSVGGQDCTTITGLSNGEPVSFEARSVNAVGQSRGTNPSVTTWAYRAPTIDRVSATPIYDPGVTGLSQGALEVVIETNDAEVRAFTVEGVSGEVARTGGRTTVRSVLPVSAGTLTVTPLSRFDAPDGGSSAGTSTTIGVAPAGSPSASTLSVASVNSTSITVNPVTVTSNGSTKPSELVYVAYRSGEAVTCSVGATGGGLTVSGGVQSTTPTISGLSSNTRYTVRACVSNGFGVAESNTVTATPFAAPAAPAGYTYSIRDGSRDGDYSVILNGGGTAAPTGFTLVYEGDDVFDSPLSITAKFCLTDDPSLCSASGTVTPTNPNATVQFTVTAATTECSVVGGTPSLTATVTTSPMQLTGAVRDVAFDGTVVTGQFVWGVADPTNPNISGVTAYQLTCTPDLTP